jgi:[acyl-carrier-protein] S-malonyltransferase
MNCFMFPGQPFSDSRAFSHDADWWKVSELVRRHGQFDLASFSWIQDPGTDQMAYQLLGLAQSLHQMRRLHRQGIWPDLVAQHSMGIYPALVGCGSLPEAEAIELTRRVGACVAQLGKRESYAMGSVTGLPLELVQGIADNHRVYVANHNTSRHFLLSGGRQEVGLALAEAQSSGAFSARGFDCDAPLHTPLMSELDEELRFIFSGYRYEEPALPLMNHLNQDYLGGADIAWFLLRELQLPVYWERSYRALRRAGVARYFEVGEGESLRKFNRWIESDIKSGKSVEY